jgi:hypothetical protein
VQFGRDRLGGCAAQHEQRNVAFAGVSPCALSSSGAALPGWAGSMMTAMSPPAELFRWEACRSSQPPVVPGTRTVGTAAGRAVRRSMLCRRAATAYTATGRRHGHPPSRRPPDPGRPGGHAALALATSDDGPPELTAAAGELLAAIGLTGAPGGPLRGLGTSTPRQIASQAAPLLHQASALVSGCGISWNAQSDEALLAQGNASAQAARAFAQFLLPVMGDLGGRLAAPGARMLDIGTGVGALAAGFARHSPS